MTTLGIIQIIYLAINVLGAAASFYSFLRLEEFPVIPKLFRLIGKHFGNIAVAVSSILLILLFMPALFCVAIYAAFLMLWGSGAN